MRAVNVQESNIWSRTWEIFAYSKLRGTKKPHDTAAKHRSHFIAIEVPKGIPSSILVDAQDSEVQSRLGNDCSISSCQQ